MKKIFESLTALFMVTVMLVNQGTAQTGPVQIDSINPAVTTPSFPGAEGFGANTHGGPGGRVIEVTNLNDSGAGSLRNCVSATGARTCVFRTGGLIQLKSTLIVNHPYLTIAGQTAPGGGITLKANGKGDDDLDIATHDVIIRYLTFRPGPGGDDHGSQIASDGVTLSNIMLDHDTFSWGVDSNIETWYRVVNFTIQWSMITEALDCSTHHKGCHSKGLMLGGYAGSDNDNTIGSEDVSVLHNLMAHNVDRNPLMQMCGVAQVVNNVTYNSVVTFAEQQLNCLVGDGSYVNWIGNYHKKGPSTETDTDFKAISADDGTWYPGKVYVHGNIGPSRPNNNQPDSTWVDSSSRKFLVSTPAAGPEVTTTDAQTAYNDVLAEGGAGNSKALTCDGTWYNRRDAIDSRVVSEVKSGTGKIIDDPSQVGGWITPDAGTPCTDSDHDGMPDAWEVKYGLNPNQASANLDSDGDGYTNLEEYLNGTNPRSSTVPHERLVNGGFNNYMGVSKVPMNWNASQFSAGDGKDTLNKHEGTASIKIIGNLGTPKTLVQNLPVAGIAGDTLTFSFWVKGVSIPASGNICDGIVLLYNGTTVTGSRTLKCPAGTYAFKKLSITFTATGAFNKVSIRFMFNSAGTVWFDKASLIK